MSNNAKNNEIKVFIVDDHPIVRLGIRLSLSKEDGIHIIGEAGTAREATNALRRIHPDVVLMDINLPDGNGLDLTKEIVKDNDSVRVIMLSTYDSDEFVERSVRAGASGYCTKDLFPEELSQVITSVHSREKFCDRRTSENREANDLHSNVRRKEGPR